MGSRRIHVQIAAQRLELLEDGRVLAAYPVSTAARGPGEREGSERTPRGRHEVAEKIGDGQPLCAVFVGREPTGEICGAELFAAEPTRDWILSRILWLRGLEPGRNRGGSVDTQDRYIYIHGTPDEDRIGEPASHGCIRMRNDDVVELFAQVDEGTPVEIG